MEMVKTERDMDPLGEIESPITEQKVDPLIIKQELKAEGEPLSVTFPIVKTEYQLFRIQPEEELKYENTEYEVASNQEEVTEQCLGTDLNAYPDMECSYNNTYTIFPNGAFQQIEEITNCQPHTPQVPPNLSSKLDSPQVCNICGKSFSQMSDFLLHSSEHEKEQTHVCHVCGKGFKQHRTLKLHSVVHEEERSHICDVCGKAFKRRDMLKLHSVSHKECSPHICKVCGKEFKRRFCLKSHYTMHENTRAFLCNVCGKRFKWMCNLRSHSVVHKEDRPYVCQVCGKGFKLRSCLKSHYTVHKNTQSYVCNVCGKGFNWLCNLRSHSMIHERQTQVRGEVCLLYSYPPPQQE